MDLEKFKEQIWSPSNKDVSLLEKVEIKGIIARTMRLCTTYPELAKSYYDSLPKATLD